MEDVNCILNSGEVPDLFDSEEIDGIAMELKGAAAEAQIPDTRVDVYNFFVQVKITSLIETSFLASFIVFVKSY